ncbi:hypothetical protein BH18THE2_BH18THE2_43970 [soil metagenome]
MFYDHLDRIIDQRFRPIYNSIIDKMRDKFLTGLSCKGCLSVGSPAAFFILYLLRYPIQVAITIYDISYDLVGLILIETMPQVGLDSIDLVN